MKKILGGLLVVAICISGIGAQDSAATPTINSVTLLQEGVGRYEKVEMTN